MVCALMSHLITPHAHSSCPGSVEHRVFCRPSVSSAGLERPHWFRSHGDPLPNPIPDRFASGRIATAANVRSELSLPIGFIMAD
jgi:hypothetical protein